MHAADPDRCIRQRGKTSDLIGLECFEKDILKTLWPAAEISAGHSFIFTYSAAVFLSVFSTAALPSAFSAASLLSVYYLLFPFFFLNFSSFSSGSSFAMESRSFSNSASRSLVTSGY